MNGEIEVKPKLICNVCGEVISHVDHGIVFFLNNDDGTPNDDMPVIAHNEYYKPGCYRKRDKQGRRLWWIPLNNFIENLYKDDC